ncbi:hypothetical protein [Streptomyces sp. NPDC101181]|uniref:hypothetical protein n=1 Tax=Streptomyces sp. NPDC101181 TaxID=3366125 RepID=UPI003819FA16
MQQAGPQGIDLLDMVKQLVLPIDSGGGHFGTISRRAWIEPAYERLNSTPSRKKSSEILCDAAEQPFYVGSLNIFCSSGVGGSERIYRIDSFILMVNGCCLYCGNKIQPGLLGMSFGYPEPLSVMVGGLH